MMMCCKENEMCGFIMFIHSSKLFKKMSKRCLFLHSCPNLYTLQFNFDVGLVLESDFKTIPMRRRSLKAQVYFTFHVPSRSFQSVLSRRRVRTNRLKLPAHGQGAWLSASHLDDENDIVRTAEVYFCLKPHLRVCARR